MLLYIIIPIVLVYGEGSYTMKFDESVNARDKGEKHKPARMKVSGIRFFFPLLYLQSLFMNGLANEVQF